MAGFSFGAAPAAPAAGASLFGQQPGAAPSFSFSTPASNAGASTSTPAFSFGAPAQAPATSAPFSFGASAPAAGGTGLFGTKPAAAPFSFGQPQQAQAPAAGGFSFGATQPAQPSNTFSFGAPQQQQQQPALGGFSFGASQPQQQSGMFGQPAQPPAPVGPSPDSIEGQLQAIKTAWHPQSPTCRFQVRSRPRWTADAADVLLQRRRSGASPRLRQTSTRQRCRLRQGCAREPRPRAVRRSAARVT